MPRTPPIAQQPTVSGFLPQDAITRSIQPALQNIQLTIPSWEARDRDLAFLRHRFALTPRMFQMEIIPELFWRMHQFRLDHAPANALASDEVMRSLPPVDRNSAPVQEIERSDNEDDDDSDTSESSNDNFYDPNITEGSKDLLYDSDTSEGSSERDLLQLSHLGTD